MEALRMKKQRQFLLLALLLVLVGCTPKQEEPDNDNDQDVIEIESRILAFFNEPNFSGDLPDTFNTYYFNESALPYVNIEDLFGLLNGIDGPVSLSSSWVDDVFYAHHESTVIENEVDYEYTLEIDPALNQIKTDSAWFAKQDSLVKAQFLYTDLYTYTRDNTQGYTIDLNDYGFNVEYVNEQMYLPLTVATLLFTPDYVNLYYNHEELYLFEVGYYPYMRESSLKGTEIPYEIMDATYNYLRLWFDYFYGLSPYVDLGDSETFLAPFYTMIYDPDNHYQGVRYAIASFDDIHTTSYHNGIYAEEERYTDDLPDTISQPRWDAFLDAVEELTDYCVNETEGRTYLSDQTVRIHTKNISTLSTRTIQIHLEHIAENEAVENIVLDLSCNLGGTIRDMIDLISLMTDEMITFTRVYTVDGTVVELTFQSNQDVKSYNWYILVSPYTYSASNMFTSLVKEHNLGTIIGMQPAGGSSSTDLTVTPSGMTYVYSSPLHVITQEGISYEFGVPVDIEISYEDYYDVEAILSYIETEE